MPLSFQDKIKPVKSQVSFASKIRPLDAPPPQEGFVDSLKTGTVNVLKDIVGLEQNKSDAFIPSLLRSTIGSKGLAGIAQLPGRVIDAALHPDDPNNITAGQALGTTINAGLTALTGGTSSVAKQAGLTGAKALAAKAAENAVIGGGFQVGSNLSEGKPIGENVGMSSLLGAAIPLGGTIASKTKGAILNKSKPLAETFINSLIKPLNKNLAYGHNPARGIIREKIIDNNINGLSQKVSGKISEVGGRIGELGQKLDQGGLSLDLTPALAPINEAIERAAKSYNTSLFNSLNNVKTALVHELKVGVDEKGAPAIIRGDARNLLTTSYRGSVEFLDNISEHTRFTGMISDDKALNAATQKAYGITREIMNQGAGSIDQKVGVEIRDLNQRYGDLLSAKSAINHRDVVLKRRDFLNIADKFSIPISVVSSLMTGFATGDWSKAGLALATQLGIVAGTKALGSTASKTRIAQFLSRLTPEERNGILNSTPVLKNYYERLTGQETPSPGAPKTKTLQTVEDYMKNPKLGLSVKAVGNPKSFNDFIPKDQKDLSAYAELITSGKGAIIEHTNLVKKVFAKYGLKVPENPKQIASQIELLKQGAENASGEEFMNSIGKNIKK